MLAGWVGRREDQVAVSIAQTWKWYKSFLLLLHSPLHMKTPSRGHATVQGRLGVVVLCARAEEVVLVSPRQSLCIPSFCGSLVGTYRVAGPGTMVLEGTGEHLCSQS